MTDEQMTRLCLEAMYERSPTMPEGCWSVDPECRTAEWWKVDGHWRCGRCQLYFDPLKEDSHAMAVLKQFKVNVNPQSTGLCDAVIFADDDDEVRVRDAQTVNRAIVECVATMHAASTTMQRGSK